MLLRFKLPTSSLGGVGGLIDELRVFYDEIAGIGKMRHGGEEERMRKGHGVNVHAINTASRYFMS